jgi:hypothetical protein
MIILKFAAVLRIIFYKNNEESSVSTKTVTSFQTQLPRTVLRINDILLSKVNTERPIPVAARSKVYVCVRLLGLQVRLLPGA